MSGPLAVIWTVRSYSSSWTKEKVLQLSLPASLHFHKNVKQQFKHICFGGGGAGKEGAREGDPFIADSSMVWELDNHTCGSCHQ